MAQAVIMPRQGQSVESCILTEMSKKEGESVKKGEILFVCETDKATFEVEAEIEGTVLKWLAEEGDDVPCLDNVCVIGKKGEDITAFLTVKDSDKPEIKAEQEENEAESTPEIQVTAQVANQEGKLKISPRAKNLAQTQNVDLTRAMASGPQGRIIERDVASLAAQGIKVTTAAKTAYQGGGVGTGIGGAVTTADLNSIAPAPMVAEYEDEPLSNIRKVIAKTMQASLSQMAQLTLNTSFDASGILALRAQVKKGAEASGLNNITLNDMILYAVAKTLKRHRACNAHFLGDKVRYFRDVNLGIAVDTERGLLVPTVFGADRMGLNDLSQATKDIIGKAKTGSISPDYLTGGTFTITNLGAAGIESFTPVINPPQTCILGVCTITERAKTVDGKITTYPAMGLSLTMDHRALDGAPAAYFLQDLVRTLENFALNLV